MIKLEREHCLVPGPCRFISRRRLNVPSYLKAEQDFLNWLFPEGLPEPVKSPPARSNRALRPPRRPPFGRRWNDPIEALFSAINDPPPIPPFPFVRRWRNQREPRWNRASLAGQTTKSQRRRLNDPSFLKDEQEALNSLFPEGVPQPNKPPPPRLVENLARERARMFQKKAQQPPALVPGQMTKSVWRRANDSNCPGKFRFPVRAPMTRMDFWTQ